MSASKRREQANRRATAVRINNRRLGLGPICWNCGEVGPHFIPPSLGEPGFFACEPAIK